MCIRDSWSTLFAHVSTDGSLWGPILEKAFAKCHGNYEHIVGGAPEIAVRTLMNWPYIDMQHAQVEDKEALWTQLLGHAQGSDIITAATPGSSHDNTNAQGLVNNHAYTVIGCAELSDGTRLVQVRNPWAAESFVGAWSDGSSLWTDQAKADVQADPHVTHWESNDDGIFFMSFDDYFEQFQWTQVNFDTANMGESHFLMLDDPAPANGNGASWATWCGADCTKHTLTVTSDVDQTVYLTAHTWDSRGMARQCQDWDGKYHSIYWDGAPYYYVWKYGAKNVSVEMTAGQTISVDVEFDFTAPEIAKDWSLVAHGANGGVTVTHTDSSLTSSCLLYTSPSPRDRG